MGAGTPLQQRAASAMTVRPGLCSRAISRSSRATACHDLQVHPAPTLLDHLVGEELGCVVFVRDYLQLDFDGPIFTCFEMPLVDTGSDVLLPGSVGYRDRLCDLIGCVVIAVEESRAAGLSLTFAGARVACRPAPHLARVEIAMLRTREYSELSEEAMLAVWRPGDAPFDGPEWV